GELLNIMAVALECRILEIEREVAGCCRGPVLALGCPAASRERDPVVWYRDGLDWPRFGGTRGTADVELGLGLETGCAGVSWGILWLQDRLSVDAMRDIRFLRASEFFNPALQIRVECRDRIGPFGNQGCRRRSGRSGHARREGWRQGAIPR